MDWNAIRGRFSELTASEAAQGPAVRWGVAAILLILVWVWLIEPLQLWRNTLDERVARDAQKAVRLQGLQAQADAWSLSLSDSEQTLGKGVEFLFKQSSDTAAQAQLQQWVVRQIEARKLRLDNQKFLEAEQVPGVGSKLRVFVDVQGDLLNVLQFLDDVSRASYLVEIDQWLMRRQRNGEIKVQATLAGYRAESGKLMAAHDG